MLRVFTADFAASGDPPLALACLESVISATPFHLPCAPGSRRPGATQAALRRSLPRARIHFPSTASSSASSSAAPAKAEAEASRLDLVPLLPPQRRQDSSGNHFISGHGRRDRRGRVFLVDRSQSTQDMVTRELGPTRGWVVLPQCGRVGHAHLWRFGHVAKC